MSAGDAVGFWILALSSIGLFVFVYGLIEEALRSWRKPSKSVEPKLHTSKPSVSEPPKKYDWPPSLHGYDSADLVREDALMHIRENDRAVAGHEENIRAILAQIKNREGQE